MNIISDVAAATAPRLSEGEALGVLGPHAYDLTWIKDSAC